MKKILVLIFLSSIILYACASYSIYQVNYKYELLNSKNHDMFYSDSIISIKFQILKKSIGFELNNLTNNSIKIIWDNCSYIDPNGYNNHLMHTGVKYINRNSSQPSTIIVSKSKYYDELTPTENVDYISGWYTYDLFKTEVTVQENDKTKLNNILKNKGKNFSLLISFEINHKTKEYKFNFIINDVNSKFKNKFTGFKNEPAFK